MTKKNEWVAWWWANAKIDRQGKYFIVQTNSKHFQGKYGRLQFCNVYTCHEFLQRMRKFEMVNSRTLFHKLIERFVDRRVGNPWQLAINRIHETQKTTLCNSRQANLGATRIKEQSLKPFGEPSDDRASPKPWEAYDNRKQWHVEKW